MHTQTAHARYTYITSPRHRDFPKPDGRCFMACTFLHSSHIYIAWNRKTFAASSHSRVSFVHFEHVTLCMVHSPTFCIAQCFICFYQFLSRLEVHLCDIYVLGKRPLLQMHICIFVLHLLFLGMLSIKFVQTVIRQFKIYKGNKLSVMKRPNGQHH